MPLYELTDSTIQRLAETAFNTEGLKERADLQRLLRDHIGVVSPDTLVLSEEFGFWDDSKRRIDLLGLDREANLVVIELKRTIDGGFMDLQAIRYASMVSNMTFDQAVEAHAKYLSARGKDGDAKREILKFLEWEDPDENDFAQEVRLILASAEFSKELTTSVLWLFDHGIDIRCVRLKPYRMDEKLLIHAEQIIPLPEAEDYQVKVREKGRIERAQKARTKDLTKYDVSIDGATTHRLPKRRAIFAVAKALHKKGVTVAAITARLSWRGSGLWRTVDGEVDSEEFAAVATASAEQGGLAFDPGRWFYGDDELFVENGKTYALTKMWGARTEEAMQDLVSTFKEHGVSFRVSE